MNYFNQNVKNNIQNPEILSQSFNQKLDLNQKIGTGTEHWQSSYKQNSVLAKKSPTIQRAEWTYNRSAYQVES